MLPKPGTHRYHHAASAKQRLDFLHERLLDTPATEAVTVIAATTDAALSVVHRITLERGALVGWRGMSLRSFVEMLAYRHLADAGIAPMTPRSMRALVSRVIAQAAADGELRSYAKLAASPGLIFGATQTLDELRLAGVDPACSHLPAEIAALYTRYVATLDVLRFGDTKTILDAATLGVDTARPSRIAALDLNLSTYAEGRFLQALSLSTRLIAAVLPSADQSTRRTFENAGITGDALTQSPPVSALQRVQSRLFTQSTEASELDASLTIFSAPGEGRECLEIARRILGYAKKGVAFDQMAVVLRQSAAYRPHLIEAFRRAEIPVFFSQGIITPSNSGRAFLALLGCACEQLAVRRFAEYLSLGQAPGIDVAPYRFERLLNTAMIVSGQARWRRRLDLLEAQLRADKHHLEIIAKDSGSTAHLDSELETLRRLRAFDRSSMPWRRYRRSVRLANGSSTCADWRGRA